jgi:WD40 repeat protein/HEAT repeat protein
VSVQILCTACQKTYLVDPNTSGKIIRCPNGHLMTVPASLRTQTALRAAPSAAKPKTAVRPAPTPLTAPANGPARKGLPEAARASPSKLGPRTGRTETAPKRSTGAGFALLCVGLLGLLLLGASVVAGVLLSASGTNPREGGHATAPPETEQLPPNPGGGGQPDHTPGTGTVGGNPGGTTTQPDSGETRQPDKPGTTAGSGPQGDKPPKPPVGPPQGSSKLLLADNLDRTKLDVNLAPPQPDEWPPEVWDGHTNHVRAVAFTDDGQFVISVSGDMNRAIDRPADNSIRVWDARRGKQVHKVEGFKEPLDSLSVSRGGRFALFSHGGYWEGHEFIQATDPTVYLWDIQAKKLMETKFTGLQPSVFATAISPDRKTIVGGDALGRIYLWDAQSTQPIHKLEARLTRGRVQGVMQAKFSGDGRYLVVVSKDYTLRVYDSSSGKPVGVPLSDHEDEVSALDVAQSQKGGLRALSGGGSRQREDGHGFEPGARDYTIRLWDLDKGTVIGRFKGHENDVMAVAFCPDGRHFVSGSFDSTVRLWDLETGKELRQLGRHPGGVRSVAVAPDGRSCVSGGHDCKVRFWCLPTVTVQDLIDALDNHNVTDLNRLAKDIDFISHDALAESVFPQLVQAMNHGDAPFREAARHIVQGLAEATKPNDLPFEVCQLKELIGLLNADDPMAWRAAVIRGIGRKGPDAAEAIPRLLTLGESKDSSQSAAVADALGGIGKKNPEVITFLKRGIRHDAQAVRTAALQSLLRLAPDDVKWEVVLDRLQNDTSDQVTAKAEGAFLEVVPGLTSRDMAVLRRGLTCPQRSVQTACMKAVASFGADGEEAIPELIGLLQRPEAEVQVTSLQALQAVSGKNKSAVPALVKLIDDKVDFRVAILATTTLLQIDPSNDAGPKKAVPLLLACLCGSDEDVRQAAESMLEQLGERAVSPLTLSLHDSDPNKRRLAATTLGKIGPKAERSINELVKVLREDEKNVVRRAAAEALGQVGVKALPALTECLKDPQPSVRQMAAEGLGVMGPAAAPAIPELKQLLDDDKKIVSAAARRALEKIGPNR